MRQKIPLLVTVVLSFFVSLVSSVLVDTYLQQAYLWNSIGLYKSYNTGIAFGIHLGPLQSVIILAAIVLLCVSAWKTAETLWPQLAFGLLLGGALSNIVDRLLDGKVTDMIKIGTFPIFNIADTCINIGVVLLLTHAIIEKQREKNTKR